MCVGRGLAEASTHRGCARSAPGQSIPAASELGGSTVQQKRLQTKHCPAQVDRKDFLQKGGFQFSFKVRYLLLMEKVARQDTHKQKASKPPPAQHHLVKKRQRALGRRWSGNTPPAV